MMQFTIIPVTVFEQNCTVFWCDETMQGAVVDPGGDIELIKQAIVDNNVTLTKILITHAHLDHAGSANALAKEFNVPIEGPHQEDQFWIDLLPSQKSRPGFSHIEKFTSDRWLNQGDKVNFGHVELDVLFCPGHTPGHIIFFEPKTKLAQVGDVIFKGSIGRTDFPRGDFDTLINSIKHNLFLLGDDVRFIPGHGPMSTFGEEKQTNPYVGQGK